MKKIAVLTSGGDAPGMNAAIRSVVRYSIYNGLQIYGIQRGYKGLIDGELSELTLSSVGDIIHRGGTILRTARSQEFMQEEGLKKALNILEVFKIEALIGIGGDGTFRGLNTLAKQGFPVIGIPATIDNDLGYTDYTIGFDTSVNTVLDAVSKLRDTTSSHERISLIEVMGRNCGDIALYAGLAGGAEDIIIPEVEFDIDAICKKILVSASRGKTQSIIIKAEGVGKTDEISKQISQKTGMEVRETILGHIQRGGSPTANDRILASILGSFAVKQILIENYNKLLGIRNNKYVALSIEEALEEVLEEKKSFKKELYELTKILSI